MEQEIKEVIAKNLPAHVGEVLKKRLSELEETERNHKALQELFVQKEKTISELNAKLSEYSKYDDRNSKLNIREAALEERERNIKIFELTTQLECEKEKTNLVNGLAHSLVRNTEYRKSIHNNSNIPVRDQYGNITTMMQNSNTTESITEV